MNAKELAALDQAVKLLADTLPPIWWNLYNGCMGQGFDSGQSLELVKSYISASCSIVKDGDQRRT